MKVEKNKMARLGLAAIQEFTDAMMALKFNVSDISFTKPTDSKKKVDFDLISRTK